MDLESTFGLTEATYVFSEGVEDDLTTFDIDFTSDGSDVHTGYANLIPRLIAKQ